MEFADSPESSEQKVTASTLLRISKAAFVGLLIGYLVALWLSQWLWLEMRVNLGAIIPGSILVSVMLAVWGRKMFPCSLMLLLELMLVVSLVAIYGWRWEALSFIPACLFREGCHAGLLRIDAVNVLLSIILLGGNSVWLLARCRRRACESR